MQEDGKAHGASRRVVGRIFRLGDTVRIRTGPFASFVGKIEGINQAKMLLKVAVAIFGRSAPAKLYFTDVEKIAFTEDD
jgi:transcriptional antiterminator NusG